MVSAHAIIRSGQKKHHMKTRFAHVRHSVILASVIVVCIVRKVNHFVDANEMIRKLSSR